MSDILRFHCEYQGMDEANAQPSDFPFDTPTPVAGLATEQFQLTSRDARAVAKVDNQQITVDLAELWPIDRRYLGLSRTRQSSAGWTQL